MTANPDLEDRLRELSPVERAAVDAALRSDPELAEDLRPLLDGRYGERTERVFLRCLSARLRDGEPPRSVLLPALADAMRAAGERHRD